MYRVVGRGPGGAATAPAVAATVTAAIAATAVAAAREVEAKDIATLYRHLSAGGTAAAVYSGGAGAGSCHGCLAGEGRNGARGKDCGGCGAWHKQ